jgi:hypothetical protein
MGVMQNMSDAIVYVLGTIQLSGSNAFVDVEEYPTTEFTGVPAATVIPSDNTSDYATIVQNLRTYSFFVDIYYPIGIDAGGYQKAFTTMRALVDAALDAFDNSNDLNLNNQYGSSAETICDMLRPVPSSWAMVQSNGGDLLTARITLNCAKTVTTDNG